jgi:predicted alpha/beta superfamily hydrolase
VKAGWRRRGLIKAAWVFAVLSLWYCALLASFWLNRSVLFIQSAALSERRSVTVFGASGLVPKSGEVAVYSLDGDKHRHALMPAAHGAVIAWLHGDRAPLFVAIHDHRRRDVDFRPAKVQPASWRPNISGRGAAFDRFLLTELQPEITRRFGSVQRQYLFGHSLGGFYTLDMPTRQANHGFAGLYAFSPTFSHDLSLIDRLATTCANSKNVYMNIGLESARDTAIFAQAKTALQRNERCKANVQISRHFGVVHQLIMLSGQIAAFQDIYE